jgi:hypothetical protein
VQTIASLYIIFPLLVAKRWIVDTMASTRIVRNIQTDW